MLVLLPEIGQFNEFESSLSYDNLQEILDSLKRKNANVFLPRFEFESRFNLSSQLRALGIVEAFDPTLADFSGMHGMPPPAGIWMDRVIHKTFVPVDEEGTEAAASTAVIFKSVSAPEETFEFKADRPFFFLVRDDDTGTILFMGIMLNPCAGTGECETGDNPVVEEELPPSPTPGPGRRLNVSGPVRAFTGELEGQDDPAIYKITFDVALRGTERQIDLTPPFLSGESCARLAVKPVQEPCVNPAAADSGIIAVVEYIDNKQYLPNTPWTVEFSEDSSSDYLLERGEQATITVWLLRRVFVPGSTVGADVVSRWDRGITGPVGLQPDSGILLGTNDQFHLELTPNYRQRLAINRTLPSRFESVMNLR